ncbi:MAG: CDP-alcohol phosphatidyltransferase family protein [Patescibacteria group bacterium]|nr:CDP-alcohol phosphatidyltransferase family protein [Patescibacteria group bacterium]
MLTEKREIFKQIESKTGKIFSKLGFSPNQYTSSSIFFAVFSFYFLVKFNLFLAFIFFLLAVALDFVDGSVARITKRETKKGAYLDTIFDRYVEAIILLGFLFLPLSFFILPPSIWIFIALFGSLMTTYSKAAAREKGLVTQELKKGLFGRPERIILISLSMVLGVFNLSLIIYPIIFLAVLSNITALQRIYLALNKN